MMRPFAITLLTLFVACTPREPDPKPPGTVPERYNTGGEHPRDSEQEAPSETPPETETHERPGATTGQGAATPDGKPSSASRLDSPPGRADRGTAGTGPSVNGRWWQRFDDPQLNELVQRALSSSLDVQTAWSRLQQANAQATQANSARWPQVALQGDVRYQRAIQSFGTSEGTTATVSLPVSYEVDLWGRFAAEGNAAELQADASRAQYESAAMTTAAQVAETWYDLVATRAQREVLEQQLELAETLLELVKLRFKQGLVSALDVHQQRQQVASTRSQLSQLDAQQESLRQRLALLVGANPGEQIVSSDRAQLPDMPPPPEKGVPATLLDNRPDVRAAQQQVEATDARTWATISSRLPSLTLTTTPGYTWNRSEFSLSGGGPGGGGGGDQPSTEHGFQWSAGATLNIPLFDGFRRKGQVEQAEAAHREALHNYARTMRQAMLEVQTALAQEKAQRNFIDDLEEELETAEATLEAARDRYREGLTDYLPVLNALQTKQRVELSLLEARRQLLSFRIQLHRALGGTWTQELGKPQEESSR